MAIRESEYIAAALWISTQSPPEIATASGVSELAQGLPTD
jgi:hypothetical protein